jgi:type VII secretion-associated serine protease mycosin
MHGRRTWATLAATTLAAATLAVAGPSVAAAADGDCGDNLSQPGSAISSEPWQQRWLDPERVWPFATGAGQTVAIVDTGVDGTHAQFAAGQVLAGWDFKRNKADSNIDCLGHGTAVASLVGAQRDDTVGYHGVPFHGVAPGAKILPVRISDVDPSSDPNGNKQPGEASIAAGISWAAQHGATVIEVSNALDFYTPGGPLEAAVKHALSAGIVVVAAVGDEHDPTKSPIDTNYPASFDGVIGVGAVDSGYLRSDKSDVGPEVDVVAPGDGVIAAARAAGYEQYTGTSIAAGIVAGTAALVREAWPQLTPDQVAQRLAATADPSPGGQHGYEYGRGIIDPYRAVTEQVSTARPVPLRGVTKPKPDPKAIAADRWWHWTSTVALIAGGCAALALILLVAISVILPRGRRRQWRAGRAPRPVDPPEEVPDDNPELLFAVPKPHGGTEDGG